MRTTATRFPAAVQPQSDWRDLASPQWVQDLLCRSIKRSVDHPQFQIHLTGSSEFSLVSLRLVDAVNLVPAEFERFTTAAYNAIAAQLAPLPSKYPVRFWNYIPAIHAPMDAGRDRYMVFNAGRFEAFASWYGGPQSFETHVATASGVGHSGSDFVIHCLASSTPGRAIENPRQIPCYRYSTRFGPRPPCFSRATVLPTTSPMLLVGGTASIRGEDTVHLNDLAEQTAETLDNLAALLQVAGGNRESTIDRSILRQFKDLRVYHPQAQHAAQLRQLLAAAFPSLQNLELVQADLCRPDLLVEIEGLAELPSA
jgi:chorismate lyase / 3-hydroxybenzoate synthase